MSGRFLRQDVAKRIMGKYNIMAVGDWQHLGKFFGQNKCGVTQKNASHFNWVKTNNA